MSLTTNLETFYQQPFQAGMDLWGWVLFTIVVITIAFLWYSILDSFKKVA